MAESHTHYTLWSIAALAAAVVLWILGFIPLPYAPVLTLLALIASFGLGIMGLRSAKPGDAWRWLAIATTVLAGVGALWLAALLVLLRP